ncbi:hypothetical protein EIP91_004005 [Steccherinum ochraceum]|uniref:PH domain-containing protein n=1 Tax=Steccherinum ochraceum TaxID=92696 RepID=A0A4R0RI24_9APHY|nr:hypothetical protein EIP91_004005 [Steccherinum ochraceum]
MAAPNHVVADLLPAVDSSATAPSLLSKRPSRSRISSRTHPATLNLDSVLYDLWPSLTQQHTPDPDFQNLPFGAIHLQHAAPLKLKSQDPAILPESERIHDKALFDGNFDEHFSTVLRPRYPSPLTSPLPTPDLEATTFTSDPNVQQLSIETSGYFNMVKNRRSLQSILIPPFLQSNSSNDSSPTQSTRIRSLSAAASTTSFSIPPAIPLAIPPSPAPLFPTTPPRNSPPSDLLDDDPFADLTAGPSVVSVAPSRSRTDSLSRASSVLDTPAPHPPTPRSPLSQSSFGESDYAFYPSFDASSSSEILANPPTTPPPTPVLRSKSVGSPKRPWSSGHGQARPAYTRPAFKPRPSLPSLSTLAKAQVVIPKVRPGRVGAQLPSEPWSAQSSDSETSRDEETAEDADAAPEFSVTPGIGRRPSQTRRPSGLTTIRDSRILTGALVTSPIDMEEGFSHHAQLFANNDEFEGVDTNDTSSTRQPRADLFADDLISMRVDGPGLTRAHSEPYPFFRPLSGLHSLDSHARSSLPTDVDGDLAYDFPSPPRSLSKRSGSCFLEGPSYSTIFPTDTRYLDLTASLNDHSLPIHDDLAHLGPMDAHEALEAIGYSPSSTFGTRGKPDVEEEFEPGTSAETIRTLTTSSHRRTSSNNSQTLEWVSDTGSVPHSPSSLSESGSSDQSSGHESHLAYDGVLDPDHDVLEGEPDDFLTFHSDSSEESLSPTLMSLSMTTSSESAPSTSSATRTPPLTTPYNSIYVDEDIPFELDEDVLPMPRSPLMQKALSRASSYSSSEPGESKYVTAIEEMADNGEGSSGGRRSEHNGNYGGSSSGSGRWTSEGHSGRGGGHGGFSNGSGGGGGHGRDGDDRWNRRPPVRATLPVRDDSETSESEDDYGQEDECTQVISRSPAKNRATPSRSASSRPRHESETDDDVPLAQQIPTALRAQKTIRRQVKDEMDMRRKKRAETKPSSSTSAQADVVGARPRGSSNTDSNTRSSTRDALQTSAPSAPAPAPLSTSKPLTRPRTKTLPGNSINPFSPTDLKEKLLGLQSTRHVKRPSDDLTSRNHPAVRAAPVPLESQPAPAAEGSRFLRAQRSFHRPRTAEMDFPSQAPPMPGYDSDVKLGRSATTASRRPPRQEQQPPPGSFDPHLTLSSDGGSSSASRPRARTISSRRPSLEPPGNGADEQGASSRRPPLPPLPSQEAVATFAPAPKPTWQQRVFISGLQRYCQVVVDASTTAGDVLRMMERDGQLRGGPNLGPAGGWMLWEICHDFGMERPIRSFEEITSVSGSWVADKTTNAFMAKMTTLAPQLSRTAIPTSSPIFSGFVQHEYKRGKWQKRFLELREHSLWLSKKESGKDQICLCSLQNFDAYVVTRVQKAPKGYVFAIKSTDNLSFFENTSDYMHLLSCSEKEGAEWLSKILLARSYVLHQERNVLTNTTVTAPTVATTGTGAALSRAGTRKRPAQPLVTIGHVATHEVPIAPAVFEPGSLLAKRVS